jgi:RHS repeat-associated protein
LDQDGTITETETNASGDVIRTTIFGNAAVPAVTTTYRRSGLTTTTTVKSHVVSIETRDAAGRVVSSQDASGAVVGTAYTSGGSTVTRTAPGGVTTVETRHYDGQAVSITGSGVIPQYFDYSVDSNGLVTTTTTVGDVQNNTRVTSVTRNRDGSTALETSPDPAGGTGTVVRTYQYASGSSALVRVSSSASNTADQVQLNPASSAEAAMGHYSLSGFETDDDGPVISSTDRLTETSTSYEPSGSVWNRRTFTRVFHTDDSDASYTRTSLEALAPVAVSSESYGGGLRWISSSTNGTTTVTTTRDSFFAGAASVVSTDDSATTASPDSVSVSNHGRTVSNSAYGDTTPETMAYDASGRLIRHMSATGAVTTYAYNSAGQLVTTTDHAGKTTSYTYHPANDAAAGLLWTSTNPEGKVTETLYNNLGQVAETKGTGTYHVTYDYNDYGEKDEMRTFQSSTSSGDLTQWIVYPATGLLYQKIDAASKVTTYTYDSSGNIHTREWARPGAITTTYTRNAFGDLTNIDYSDSTPAVTITPDRLGRPSQIADASGTRTQTYHPVTGGLDLVAYANSGLLASREVDYTWDSSLRPAGYEVSGGPASTLTYDSAGRLDTVSSYGITHTHGYTAGTGSLSSLTSSGTSLILTRTLYHDRMQRLFGIVTTNASGTHLSRHGYTFDDVGRRVRATRENGQRWDYGYDDVGQVTSGVKKFPNATAIPGHSFAYQYDGIGNRTSATHGGTDTGVTYTPNALNQYSDITTEGGRFILGEAPLANDVIINGDTNTPAARAGGLGFYWKQITGDNSAGPLWSNDSVVSDGVTITGNTWTPPVSVVPVHDFDGNLTYDGRWDSVWDAENRLIRMQTSDIAAAAGVPRQRLDFVYDSQNRRVSKTVSTSTDGTTWIFSSNLRSLYDGWNIIAEYSAPSSESTTLTLQAAHVWGIDLSGTLQGAGGVGGLLCSTLMGENSTTNNCYPAYDGNGNISAWLGASGNLLARMDYSPFGQLVAQYKFTGTGDTTLSRLHFGFSTKYTDSETGLLYYIQRYYNPVTGGWQSKDPIGESGGFNLYGYVGNDGIGKWDILGLMTPYGWGTDLPTPPPQSYPMHEALDTLFDAASERYRGSRILINHEVNILMAVGLLKNAYHSVTIKGTNDPDQSYSKFFRTMYLNRKYDIYDVAHESAHAYNHMMKTGIPFAQEDDEGMGYGIEFILHWADSIVILENLTRDYYFDCGSKGMQLQRAWREVWTGGVGRKPGDKAKVTHKVRSPMTVRDYGNIKTHLRTSVRCEVAAKILTESSIGKSCCYRFSCDSGRWVDNIETEKGYTFYASESAPVDPAFR